MRMSTNIREGEIRRLFPILLDKSFSFRDGARRRVPRPRRCTTTPWCRQRRDLLLASLIVNQAIAGVPSKRPPPRLARRQPDEGIRARDGAGKRRGPRGVPPRPDRSLPRRRRDRRERVTGRVDNARVRRRVHRGQRERRERGEGHHRYGRSLHSPAVRGGGVHGVHG